VLLIVISLVPLTAAFKSYLWEMRRELHGEGDLLYDQFIAEEFKLMPEGGRSDGRYTDYSVPSLSFKPYVVQKGDSLYSISKRHGVTIGSIISANQLDEAYLIRVGTVLRLPNMSGIFYTVRKGDSLSSITARYGVDMNRLVDVNDLASSTIYAGQRLFVPGGKLSDWELAEALGTLFVYPVKGRLTSKVGFRIDPFTRKRAYHTGIDLANRTGTPVTASQSGKVSYVGYQGNYGKAVIIAHQQGYSTLYGHLDKILVKRGQVVRQGERIGTVGNTGRSTGPHLHFEIHQYRSILDPLKILTR
jgi:murein DD-endopeptidase MepM/ murein hydrolase activator NlpD